MARSFSNTKVLSAFVSDSVSAFLSRRGYAAGSQGVVSGGAKGGVPRSNMMMNKSGEESVKTSWVPDPVTGYYRPEGVANEIDAAELRKMLLKHKPRNN
ncbi:protein SENESCENCE-ASSOCIATED GENE 21, mitochondrial-like [Nicotiana tabacum]|uniref:Protein SENESCENCE-ASSOCIATED GENE 21, mitochondrial-like n=1 Tax=Nicotiana tabacum TaxID=4097 RepID=A0A1S4ABA1_TOBAC|nr:protein SENESCENCE-ASSOCIATED GENE 21, mitochondrial-like [Nicotiana tomentosiformis]XP_016473881.1 PREDICTED: protein SENESCENCE-ASSOCIATED GENE 21, mitochondrial-like [Nicotiana tabacum]